MAQDTGPSSLLAWVDLEMTGLDPERDRIIELACIMTDNQLEEVAVMPVIAVHQPESVLQLMDAWNQKTHGESGLIERVRASTVSETQAEQIMLDFLNAHLPAGSSPLCGNSIGQDRRFLVKYMPRVEAWFHYRNLDVSTLKELGRRWAPAVVKSFQKTASHQALDDVRESIAELRHYRQHLLRLD